VWEIPAWSAARRLPESGEAHPDAAETAARWSRAVLRDAWCNRLPAWVQQAASVALMLLGWLSPAALVLMPGGALLAGLVDGNPRNTARRIPRAGDRPVRETVSIMMVA
jgi:hypothetical protein